MKAAILAGGVGTRLRPLTYLVPKAMLPVGGKPLLERTLQYLTEYGIKEVVICIAYLKNQIKDYFRDYTPFGAKITYAEADMPLGTGGQLKTAEKFLTETFLAMNGDIITSLNLAKLIESHLSKDVIATIALKKYETKIPYGFVTIDSDSSLVKFEEKPTLSFLANAGIYVMEPRIFRLIPEEQVVSLETDVFPLLLSSGEKIGSYYEDAYWADVGSMSDFEQVDKDLLTTYFAKSTIPAAKHSSP